MCTHNPACPPRAEAKCKCGSKGKKKSNSKKMMVKDKRKEDPRGVEEKKFDLNM